MADDLEAFLRQAAQRRAQKAAGAPQAPTAAPRPTPAAPARSPSPSPLQARRPAARPTQSPAPTAEVVAAEVVAGEPVSRFRTSVNTSSIAQHATQLGEEVGLADEHMEQHLSKAFDHQIGSPGGPQAATLQPTTTVSFDSALDVESLLEMLTKPSSVRNAIVLSEILRRPDFD